MALNFKKYYLVLRQVCLVEYMAFSFKKYYLSLRQVASGSVISNSGLDYSLYLIIVHKY